MADSNYSKFKGVGGSLAPKEESLGLPPAVSISFGTFLPLATPFPTVAAGS